ncbi:MAG: F0F1 ATP synthase subunit delta [Gammaproteobacteria bacterium]
MQELIPAARPYAKATFQASLDAGQQASLANELTLLKNAYKEKPIFEMVNNPSISREASAKKLADIFSSELSQIAKNLITTLGKNDRLELLPTISDIFDALLREHNKSKLIEVSLSHLTPEIKNNLSQKIKHKYGDCEITFNQSKELIGGLLIKIGDEVLDLSIKGRIQKLVNQLNI